MPCIGRIAWPRSSPTGSCMSTSAVSIPTGTRLSRERRCAGSSTRSGFRWRGSRPASPAQAALYRSLLAGKRVLVVLDNARDVEQVRPLLPGSSGCLAIVTSRNHLTGLVVTEGAYPLTLNLLTAADAADLLALRLGASRVASEPDAVEDIIAACARLPLALTIVAARAAIHPSFPLAAFASELHEATGTLDPLSGGDLASDVRTVFSVLLPRPELPARRGCSGSLACTPARTSLSPARPASPLSRQTRSPRPAVRADPRAPGRRARPRPVRLPRPAPRLRHRTGAQARQPRRP